MRELALFLEGKWSSTQRRVDVLSPFSGRPVASVSQAGPDEVERALSFAYASRTVVGSRSTGERRAVLFKVAEGLRERQNELEMVICEEAGKPLKAARVEVRRAIETFTLAASELASFGGRTLPVDLDPAAVGYECETRRFPAGVVVGIVPFNFPLNLGAHKVAPALAVGAPIIVKPPPQAPSAQLLLAQIVEAAGAHPAALQTLSCDNANAERLATDPRVRVLSFTGSARVGWMLKAKAPGKVVLELGGNAAVIVCKDADLEWAVERCTIGGFNHAGQVCIKVQRIYVEQDVAARFTELLAQRVTQLVPQDPAREDTVVGPLIDDAAAARVEEWVDEAARRGGRVLVGGRRQGRLFEPTVMVDTPKDVRVSREEVFGPVVVVSAVRDFDAAVEAVNDTDYGLQAGVFTRDLIKVRRAFRELEVGGVIVNDYPTFRSDNYPYGGVKRSGLGREGVRAAMEELTEERVLVTRAL